MRAENRCRICFTEENQEEMFVPCACKGSMKFAHKECLINWRNESETDITSVEMAG
ncbi:hypothetical protein B4U80_01297 [Leptotrombidium deliense]|uniref:RING-CH-type domain-containing protein n=1 Tax=Leptotrombidium deliense TaxID=299467 RepID=A0A443S578_9ACAR|nr:hypothetical protein B4U80_01297 [Leptotrombidium deliense]